MSLSLALLFRKVKVVYIATSVLIFLVVIFVVRITLPSMWIRQLAVKPQRQRQFKIIVGLAYDSSPASQVPSRRNRDVLASEMSGFHFKVTLHEFTIKFIYKTIQKYPRLQLKKIRNI